MDQEICFGETVSIVLRLPLNHALHPLGAAFNRPFNFRASCSILSRISQQGECFRQRDARDPIGFVLIRP